MPVINLDLYELKRLMGRDVSLQEYMDKIPMIGADLGIPGDDILPVEFFPDRPDLFSVEGAARSLRYFMASNEELADMPLPEYHVLPSGIELRVDASVNDVRPFVVAAVVRGVTMSDPLIQSLMDHQEKLHLSIGRKRVKAAIGVHDISRVQGPFLYTAKSGDHSFIPLMRDHEMTLREILDHHEKGMAYKHILEKYDHYPIIEDRDGQVLSFPPIINGTLTAVHDDTTDLFIDVTGMELRPITMALNILVTSLAERGGIVQDVRITYADDHAMGSGLKLTTPDLSWKKMKISTDELNSLLNTSLPAEKWILPLKRMALKAIVGESDDLVYGENGKDEIDRNKGNERAKDDILTVLFPPYRADILHGWDIIEDAAIGLGYYSIPVTTSKVQTIGAPLKFVPLLRTFRRTLSGLGYCEVKTLTLTGVEEGYLNMGIAPVDNDAVILNPITEEHTRLRTSLIPSLLTILKANKHRELPQRIFEPAVVLDNMKKLWKCSGVAIHSKAGFTEMKSTILSLLQVFRGDYSLVPVDDPSFIQGRCAGIHDGEKVIGHFGELHPSVITSFLLDYPVIAFELDLKAFYSE